jgi:hypothetical protein
MKGPRGDKKKEKIVMLNLNIKSAKKSPLRILVVLYRNYSLRRTENEKRSSNST